MQGIARIAVSISFFLSCVGRGDEPVAAISTNLNSSNVAIRRSAVKQLAVEKPETKGRQILPILQNALEDKDAEVRRSASAAIYRITELSTWSQEQRKDLNVSPDFVQGSPIWGPLRKSLLDALKDADREVRENVIHALVTYPFTTEIEAALISHYASESSPTARSLILGWLARSNSPEAPTLILKALDDADSGVRGWAADALKHVNPLPTRGMEKLVSGYEKESDPFTKQKFVDAIGTYRSKAAAYLPKLKELHRNESDSVTRLAWENSIRNIEESSEKK
jgi:HEAT repeat protein